MKQLFSKLLEAFLLTSAVVLSWSEYSLKVLSQYHMGASSSALGLRDGIFDTTLNPIWYFYNTFS